MRGEWARTVLREDSEETAGDGEIWDVEKGQSQQHQSTKQTEGSWRDGIRLEA